MESQFHLFGSAQILADADETAEFPQAKEHFSKSHSVRDVGGIQIFDWNAVGEYGRVRKATDVDASNKLITICQLICLNIFVALDPVTKQDLFY